MSSQLKTEISKQARIRADAVGVLVGLLVLCARNALNALPEGLLPQFQVAALLIPASIAGFTAALVLPSDLTDRHLAFGIAARKGLRAGVMAVLVAGSLLSFLTRSDALNASSALAEVALKGHMWLTFLVCLASLLPSVVCGFVGGAVGCKIAIRFIPSPPSLENDAEPQAWLPWASRSVVVFACLGLLSPLTLIGRAPKVDPPPPVFVPQPKPPPPAPPPPFHFVASPDFATAKLGQINVDISKTINGVDAQAPMALTPDYTVFAFCDRSRREPLITVFDLDWFRPIASISVPAFPQRKLAWSPDYRRLACVISTDNQDSRVWVLDIASGRSIQLPRPKNGDIPGGDYYWWSPTEVAFFPSDEKPLVFDLDTLMLKPIDSSTFLSKADAATKRRWTDGPRSELPTFSRWSLGMTDVVDQDTPPPRRRPDDSWRFKTQSHWAFIDPKLGIAHVLAVLPVSEGMKCFCPPDASKLILVFGQQADIIFMKLTLPPKWCIEVEMPVVFEGIGDESVKSQVSKKEICAFVYRPLINPLTGKTVGPDHDDVKATLRLHDWSAGRATFFITQLLSPLDPEDVVSTLHTWEAGVPLAWKPSHKPDWWTLAGGAVAKEIKESTGSLEMPRSLDVELTNSAFTVVAHSRSFAPRIRPQAKVVEQAPPPQPTPAPVNAAEAEVKAFIEQHHRKASQGDIQGMMADYAELVNFLDKGNILKDKIATEEMAHREVWQIGHESIQGPINLGLEGDVWKATYTVEFRNENLKGDWQSGLVDLEMQIKPFKVGLLIVSHKAKVHDIKHGEGIPKPAPKQAGPPLVKIRLPGPVWATTTTTRLGNETVFIHEAVSIVQGHLTIHRTYRVLVDASTPRAIAAKHPNGIISMQTAEIEGSLQFAGQNQFTAYIGRQGWVQAADAREGEWSKACEQHAALSVGSSITFQEQGDELAVGSTRFKLIKKAAR